MADDIHDDTGTPKTEEVKAFTQNDVNKIVSERVNEVNAGKQKAIDEAVAKALADYDEQKRIESLKGEEQLKAKYEADLKKAKKDQDTASAELADVKRQLALTKAVAQLAELGIPGSFAPNLLGADDAETTKNIKEFSAKVNELVTQKVNESVARHAPSVGGAIPKANQFAEIDRAMGMHH